MITDTELERLERLAPSYTPEQLQKELLIRACGGHEGTSELEIMCAAAAMGIRKLRAENARLEAEMNDWRNGDLRGVQAHMNAFFARAEAAEAENKRLHEMTGVSVTVGGGLQVYGEMDAIRRVQDYIMLDSTHPVEKEDVRRSLVRSLQAAEAENERLRTEVADLKQTVISFAGPWAVQYAKDAGLPRGHLNPTHYDILERCGARMVDFTRAHMENTNG